MRNADNRKKDILTIRNASTLMHCKIYRFDGFSQAVICISSLEKFCSHLSFTLYFLNGIYYLWLCFDNKYRSPILGTISEFAIPANINLRHVLREHGEVVCRGFYQIG